MVQPGLENGSQKGEVPEWGEGWGRCFVHRRRPIPQRPVLRNPCPRTLVSSPVPAPLTPLGVALMAHR